MQKEETRVRCECIPGRTWEGSEETEISSKKMVKVAGVEYGMSDRWGEEPLYE